MASSASVQTMKATLRQEVKKLIATITQEDRLARSILLMSKVVAHHRFQASDRVAIYLSMPEEVDTNSLLQHIFPNKICFVPRYHGDNMEMLRVHSLVDAQTLPLTKWKVPQPALDDNSRENALESGGLDLILVPGLAFTTDGRRLGRGKGYYDRFIRKCRRYHEEHNQSTATHKKPFLLAVAFREQLLDDIPTSEQDEIVDEVIVV